jgi:Na+/proline symporter
LSAAIAAVILIPLAFLLTSLGIFARSLYPGASPEQAIPVLLTGLLSPATEGLVAAALLAAFMSSADTSLMTATSILTLDIYRERLGLTPSGALAALLGGGVNVIFLGQTYPMQGMAISAAFLLGVSWLEDSIRRKNAKTRFSGLAQMTQLSTIKHLYFQVNVNMT